MFGKLKSELQNRPELQKAVKAVAYLGSESGLRIVIGFFIHTWIARYLGPEKFGEMNYIRQFTILFVLFSGLGVDDIFFKKLVENKDEVSSITNEVFWLRVMSSSLMYLVFVVTILMQSGWDGMIPVLMTYGLTILLVPFVSFETVFFSKLQNKAVFFNRIVGYTAGNVTKVGGIFLKLGMPLFLLSYFIEELVSRIIITYKYFQQYRLSQIVVFSKFQKEIFKESLPLFAVALIYFVDQRMGLYFVKNYSGDVELGFYSVSTTLIELWYFLPMIITSSLFPKLIESKSLVNGALEKRFQYVFDVCIWLSLGLCLSVYILGDFIINVLYGSNYQGASETIKIVSLGSIFYFFALPKAKYLIIQNQQKIAGLFSFTSFAINLSLLIFFKDVMSSKVVVLSGITSFTLSSIIFSVINEDIRRTNIMFIKTLLFPVKILKRIF